MDMHFIETDLLRIGYREWNPDGRHTVVLTHGWPDSIRCWHHVVPFLTEAGYRVIAPALRGFLPTTFLREDTPRTGQLSALGRDMVDFVAAKIRQWVPALQAHVRTKGCPVERIEIKIHRP